MFFSYLPLAHIFDRVIEEVFISTGASIGFWRGVRYGPQNSVVFELFTVTSFTNCVSRILNY